MTVFARTALHQGRPDRVDACIAYLRDTAVPTILGMPTCVGMSVLASRRSGLAVISTAWETKADMHASVVKIRPIRDKTAEAIGGGTAELEEWRIAAMHRRPHTGHPVCARVIWLRVQSSGVDALVSEFHAAVIPALEATRGFCSTSLMVNPDWGRAAVSIAYESRDAMDRRINAPDGRRLLETNVIQVREFDEVMPHLRVPDLASY
ncbi:MAG TPA: hypothetical protein VIC62_00820 [Nakamurella sp.]